MKQDSIIWDTLTSVEEMQANSFQDASCNSRGEVNKISKQRMEIEHSRQAL